MDRIKKSDNKIKRSDRKEKVTSVIRPIVNNYRRLQGKQNIAYKSNNEESSDQVVDDAIDDSINASKTTMYRAGRKTVKSFQTKEPNTTRNLQLRSTHTSFINKAGVTFRNKLASLINTSKNTIANTKVITVAIASVGSIAIVFSILICMIGLLSGSSFGIFMATEDTGTGYTLESVVQDIMDDFNDAVEVIKSDNPHDTFEMVEPEFNWKDILAVYAVIVSTESDAVTFDEQKAMLLKDIFWSFTELVYETEDYEESGTIEVYDEYGNLYEQEVSVSKIRLMVYTKNKTAAETAVEYMFDEHMLEQMNELLDIKHDSLWAFVEIL